MGIRPLRRGYNGTLTKVETHKVTAMIRISLSIAAAAAALLCLGTSSSQAQYYGTAPWCAVTAMGTGGVHYDCEYANVETCTPNVLAGNRGFCARNPYFGHPENYTGGWQFSQEPPVTPYPHYRHYSRHQPTKHSHKS
jgi:hypothetical protein